MFPSISLFFTLSQSHLQWPREETQDHLRLPDKAAKEKETTIRDVGHRKEDNSEWGKRMEKTLAQMDKRKEAEQKETAIDSDDDDIPILQIISKQKQRQSAIPKTKLLSGRETAEMAKNGEVSTWSSDSEGDEVPIKETIQTKTHTPELVQYKDIGMKVARDFGKKGVFLGEIVAVEYDSEDIDKVEDIYVVKYTDGDRDDMDKDEVLYANEFYIQVSGVDDDTPEGSPHTSQFW